MPIFKHDNQGQYKHKITKKSKQQLDTNRYTKRENKEGEQ